MSPLIEPKTALFTKSKVAPPGDGRAGSLSTVRLEAMKTEAMKTEAVQLDTVQPELASRRTCELPLRECGAAAVLLSGGPVRVPFQACCAAALVQESGGADGHGLGGANRRGLDADRRAPGGTDGQHRDRDGGRGLGSAGGERAE